MPSSPTAPPLHTNRRHAPPPIAGRGLFLSLAGGLVAAAFDVAQTLKTAELTHHLLLESMTDHPPLVLQYLMVGWGVGSLVCCAVWALALPVARWMGLEPARFTISIILATATLLSLLAADSYFLIEDDFQLRFLLHHHGMPYFWIFTILALGVAILAYGLLSPLMHSPRTRSHVVPALGLIPVLVLIWLLYRYLLFTGRIPMTGLGFRLLTMVFFLLLALTLPLGLRLLQTPGARRGALAMAGTGLLLAATAAWMASWSDSTAPLQADHTSPVDHVILISIDTLRTDALTSYGADPAQSPNIHRLADDGVLFERAISAAPWTSPAVASFLSGVSPACHYIMTSGGLPETVPSIAAYMRRAGFFTGALGIQVRLLKGTGFEQGFHTYRFYPRAYPLPTSAALAARCLASHRYGQSNSQRITDLAIDWIEANRHRPFFFWLHYLDPHQPYEPPRAYMGRVEPPTDRFGYVFARDGQQIRAAAPLAHLTDAEKQWARQLYQAEVRYVDHNLGRLFDKLMQWNLYERALIVLTSDHGEEFWDHGKWSHGHTLYQELLNVPLVIKPPEALQHLAGRRVSTFVSTMSIPATILRMCSIQPGEKNSVMAPSLVPLMANQPDAQPQASIVSEGLLYGPQRESIIFDQQKYIRNLEGPDKECYDLLNDPREQENLAPTRPGFIRHAHRLLEADRKRAQANRVFLGVTGGRQVRLSPEARGALEALGYL